MDNETEQEPQPAVVDEAGDEAWVWVVEEHIVLELYVDTGVCDHGAEHFATVAHQYTAAQARILAAALLNAADAL